jgi:hypothetical protein
MRLQRFAHRRPGGVDAGIPQRFFDRDQEMVSQHAKKDVRLYTCFGSIAKIVVQTISMFYDFHGMPYP